MGDLSQLLGRTLVIVAHPDDETAGCGGLLQRIAEPVVVFCTDGAPRDEFFWRKFDSRLRYMRQREEEARKALSIIGANELIFLAARPQQGPYPTDDLFVDQELYRAIPPTAEALAEVVQRYRPQALLTLAYEGGHPDHDVCSFLTSVLARDHRLPAWEFPLYHRQSSGTLAFQQFVVPGESETVLALSRDEIERKRAMVAAYESQQLVMAEFDPGLERFRPLPKYDYTQPPHAGALNYEAWGWPMRGTDLVRAFDGFLQVRKDGAPHLPGFGRCGLKEKARIRERRADVGRRHRRG